MPSFEYEPLVLSLERKTSYEEEDKGYTNGPRPLSIRIAKELGNLKEKKDSHEKEATEQTLK